MVLKLADISNPMRSLHVTMQWADRVMEEFFIQGDQETKNGLAKSPFMDRNTPQLPKCQSTFINFVVGPLVKSFKATLKSELFEELNRNITENEKYWLSQCPPSTTNSQQQLASSNSQQRLASSKD